MCFCVCANKIHTHKHWNNHKNQRKNVAKLVASHCFLCVSVFAHHLCFFCIQKLRFHVKITQNTYALKKKQKNKKKQIPAQHKVSVKPQTLKIVKGKCSFQVRIDTLSMYNENKQFKLKFHTVKPEFNIPIYETKPFRLVFSVFYFFFIFVFVFFLLHIVART